MCDLIECVWISHVICIMSFNMLWTSLTEKDFLKQENEPMACQLQTNCLQNWLIGSINATEVSSDDRITQSKFVFGKEMRNSSVLRLERRTLPSKSGSTTLPS